MGWLIKITQARPGPSISAGTEGVSRRDLWLDGALTLEAVWGGGGDPPPGDHVFKWQILDRPPGSASVFAGGLGGARLGRVDADGDEPHERDDGAARRRHVLVPHPADRR